ncbi:MAG TPA: nucleotidyltransferase domain-containing protein, partial [Ktedonobacteraceae bacterium]
MKEILLQSSLGHSQADAVVQEVIFVYENAFPEQIAAYYVEGSYADQTYLTTSDIDVVIVFRDPISLESRHQIASTWINDQTSLLEVDITITDEESLQAGVNPNLKLGSRFMYGQDVCQNYPILPIEV